MGDEAQKFKELVEKVSASNDADIIVYSGGIDSPSDQELMDQVQRYRCKPNVMLFLTTNGGSAETAYRIARCLQRGYEGGRIILFVDSTCKSAGTLIALGAHEIVMADLAELGPLDVQLYKSDELAEMTSGLTPVQALTTLRTEAFNTFEDCFLKLRFRSGLQITTKTAADIAARIAIGLFGKVYAQLDPMRLGEYQRALLIAHHYGTRIARDNLKEDTLDRLIADYPSHGFIIDREEAEALFHKVRAPDEYEDQLAAILRPMAHEAMVGGRSAVVQFLPSGEEDTGQGDENDANDFKSGEVPSSPRADSQPSLGDGKSQSFGQTADPKGSATQNKDSQQAEANPTRRIKTR